LGLRLCDEIALLHGGEITFESEVGVGTTVTLRLPDVSSDASIEPVSDIIGSNEIDNEEAIK